MNTFFHKKEKTKNKNKSKVNIKLCYRKNLQKKFNTETNPKKLQQKRDKYNIKQLIDEVFVM